MQPHGGITPFVEVRVVEALAELLFSVDADDNGTTFYDRLCEVACRLADMERAIVFVYDEARRHVHSVGSHNIDIAAFRGMHIDLVSAPMALRALSEDRVIEATDGFAELLPPAYERFLDNTRLICTPIAAAGRWPGVILSDRPVDRPLTDGERHLLWSLGKIAALASSARLATREQERARQLQERIDLAREIHDGVVQRLFGVSLALSSGVELSEAERRRAGDEIQEALADLRSTVQRPLSRSPRDTNTTLLEEVRRLTSEHGRDLEIVLEADDDVEVPPHLESLAQSVLAEALRNALKHSGPDRVVVRVERNDTFVLEVRNDNAPARPRGTAGMGLRLAAVEALQHGGVIEFGPGKSGWWHVRLIVPVEAR